MTDNHWLSFNFAQYLSEKSRLLKGGDICAETFWFQFCLCLLCSPGSSLLFTKLLSSVWLLNIEAMCVCARVCVCVCDALKPPHYRLSVLHPPRQPTVHHFRNRTGSISLKFDSRSRCACPLLDAFIHSPYNTASIGGPRGNQTFLFFSLSPFLSFSSFWGEWLKICIGSWMIRVQLLSSLSEYTYNRRKMLRGNHSIVW